MLRSEAGRNPHDRALNELVGELTTRSGQFAALWAGHDVRIHTTGTKRFHHPVAGDLSLQFETLHLPGDRGPNPVHLHRRARLRIRKRAGVPRQLGGITARNTHRRRSRRRDSPSRTRAPHAQPEHAPQERQSDHMTEQKEATTDKKVWFITGAGRGMGTDIAKAALAAGHAVVATGRDPEKVARAVGENEDLLTVTLDVTDPAAGHGRRPGRRGPVRPDRRPGEQRGQLLRRLLRGDHPAGLPGADRNHHVRAHERHPRGPARPAGPTLRADHHHLLDRGHRRRGVPDRLRRVEVRRGGLGGVPGTRSRARSASAP